MKSKINKYIMASIDTVSRILVERKKRMPKMLRNSEKTIRTVSKEEVPYIICDSSNASLPEIPASNESFHFLSLENISTIFRPNIHDS